MASRRTILKATLAAGAASVFSGVLGGLSAIAQNAPRVRRSLHGMALDDPDLSAYRDFVGIMLAKNQNDPVSWLQFSLMHGTYNGNYRYCPHGDWYFLPWHREFMMMYENAAIAITGKRDFALPYWDWSVDRVMPQAFTDPTYKGKPNPLYVAGRTLNTSNWPLRDAWVAPQVLAQKVYAETNFQLFGTSRNPNQNNLDMSWVVRGGGTQGFLEGTPHNLIHNSIGAYMPSAGSPRDPIFMMHHGNIDRIWAVWNALGRSNTADMTPSDRNLWLNMYFKDNYLSPTGQTYSAYPRDLQDIRALGYTYPNLPAPDNLLSDPVRDARLLSLLAAGSSSDTLDVLRVLPAANTEAATLRAPLVKSVRFSSALQSQVTGPPADSNAAAEVFAIIREMDVGPDVSSVRVFVNAQSLSYATPSSDPHFAGEIGFLAHPDDPGAGGDHTGHHKAPPSALIELTDTVRDLARRGLLKSDNISVQLLPVLRDGAKDGAGAKIVPASIEIVVV
jgi:tyrosinase